MFLQREILLYSFLYFRIPPQLSCMSTGDITGSTFRKINANIAEGFRKSKYVLFASSLFIYMHIYFLVEFQKIKRQSQFKGKKLWSWIKRTGSPEFALKWNKLCTKLLWLVPNNFGHSARAKTEFEHTKQENSWRKKTAKNQVSMLHEQETSVSLL